MAHDLGEGSGVAGGGAALVDLIVEHTHTCYLGDREHRHPGATAAAACPACELRARGWVRYPSESGRA
jgi:7-cyano-7-deazaguanine synthase